MSSLPCTLYFYHACIPCFMLVLLYYSGLCTVAVFLWYVTYRELLVFVRHISSDEIHKIKKMLVLPEFELQNIQTEKLSINRSHQQPFKFAIGLYKSIHV